MARYTGKKIRLGEALVLSNAITEEQLQQALEEQEQAALVRQALEMLEPATKEVFLRYYYQRQKTAQIAGEMQMNASTVRSRLARGRAALRKALQERGISHEDVV